MGEIREKGGRDATEGEKRGERGKKEKGLFKEIYASVVFFWPFFYLKKKKKNRKRLPSQFNAAHTVTCTQLDSSGGGGGNGNHRRGYEKRRRRSKQEENGEKEKGDEMHGPSTLL